MTPSEKLDLVNQFETALLPLQKFLADLPADLIDFRPDMPSAWTAREHIVHMLDADTFAYGRIRLCVTEPGAEVFVWDEEKWQERGAYATTNPQHALDTCQALRKVCADMVRTLVDQDWEELYVRHPQRGRLTLADVLRVYINHAPFHLNYLERNLQAAKARRHP